jgi:hypothetical protein
MSMHHGFHSLTRAIVLGLMMIVGAVYVVSHPVNTVKLVWRVLGVLVEFGNNLASGRYQ